MENLEVPSSHGLLCFILPLLTLAASVSYLVRAAEQGCQLLLKFTCYSLDRQGELGARRPVPVPDFLWEEAIGPARVSCLPRGWGHRCGPVAGIWQLLLRLWTGAGRVSLRKQMPVSSPACGLCSGGADVGTLCPCSWWVRVTAPVAAE